MKARKLKRGPVDESFERDGPGEAADSLVRDVVDRVGRSVLPDSGRSSARRDGRVGGRRVDSLRRGPGRGGSGAVEKKMYPWLLGLFVLVVIYYCIKLLQPMMAPFVTAAVLAYILDPVVNKLTGKHIGRSMASMLVMIFAFLVIVVILLIVVPMLVTQVQNIIDRLPDFFDWVNNKLLPWVNKLTNMDFKLDHTMFQSMWLDYSSGIKMTLAKLTPFLARSGGSVFGWAFNIILLPFLLYYFLLDWPKWSEGFRQLIPRRFHDRSVVVMRDLDELLGQFLRGQLLVIVIMMAVYGIGLKLVSLENGLAIGMVAGLLVFIPYLGAFTGLLLSTMAALLQFGTFWDVFLVVMVFAVGHTFELFVVTPHLVGERIGLSPLIVIFALLAFGHLMGFVGLLLALPLAAICLVFFREMRRIYLNSSLYNS